MTPLPKLACLFLAGLISIAASAQEKPPSLPLPEMQRLSKLYVGRWEYTEAYPKSAAFPDGAVNTGTYSSELGPGGNSIFNHFHSKGPVGEFDGILVITWDPKEKAYKAYVFGDFPSTLIETGQWEGDSLVFHGETPVGARTVAFRNVTKFLADGKLTSDQFMSSTGKPEKLFIHVEAVKK